MARSVVHLPSSNFVIRPIIFFVLLSHRWRSFTSAKIFERCELIDVLLENEVPPFDLSDWMCLATHASDLNSSFIDGVGSNGAGYGIFGINNTHCTVAGDLATCPNVACIQLVDDELRDDIRCGKLVAELYGFHAWPEWVSHCKDKELSEYLEGCTNGGLPEFVPPEEYTFVRGDMEKFISCKASSSYELNLDWYYDMEAHPDATISFDEGQPPRTRSIRLYFPVVDFNTTGFLCLAWTATGMVDQLVSVTVIDPSDISTTTVDPSGHSDQVVPQYEAIFPVAVVGVAVIVSISLLIYRKYLFKVYGLTEEEIQQFQDGVPSKVLRLLHPNSDADLSKDPLPFHYLPYDKRFEIQNGKLKIREFTAAAGTDEVLGRGHFGIVFKGDFQGETVAVKTPKGSTETGLSNMKALLTELKIMIHIGEHPNIVNLIGAQTGGLRHAQLYIAVEYCEFGDLENYLRQHKLFYVDPTLPTCYISGGILTSEADEGEPITFIDLLTWSTQIASGMAHLEQKKVIHGDLACRNVLLYNKGVAKLSDFGLSRHLYSKIDYVKSAESPLPWRWMSLESLTLFSFGTKSDTWSFGVTLWEIFSLGDVPYPGLSWSQEFPSLLKRGMRLLKPDHASQEIYDVMMSCWDLDPSKRPDFHFLHDSLEELKKEAQCPPWRIDMVDEDKEEYPADGDSGNESVC